MSVFRAAFSVLALAVGGALGQSGELRLAPFGTTLPAEDELRTTIGDGAQAAAVVKETVRQFLASASHRESGRVNVLAAQLPLEWLPSIDGVHIERIETETARDGWARNCLRLLRITANRAGDSLRITVFQGDKCGSHGVDYLFDKAPGGWTMRPGLRGGFGSAVGHCGCK
jgi:hypothetical protein